MQKHTKIYYDFFDYFEFQNVPCEVCNFPATETHHIHRRGMGGDPKADRIENLQAICRSCHTKMGDKKQFKAMLYRIHKVHLEALGKPFDYIWLDAQIEKYSSFETK